MPVKLGLPPHTTRHCIIRAKEFSMTLNWKIDWKNKIVILESTNYQLYDYDIWDDFDP